MQAHRGQVTFNRGPKWLLLFLIAVGVYILAANAVGDALHVGPTLPLIDVTAGQAGIDLVVVGIVLCFLWTEDVALAGVGLSKNGLWISIVGVAVFYLMINTAGIGLLTLTGSPGAVGYQWTVPPAEAIGAFISALLLTAVSEELAYRGYLQSKLIAVLPRELRFRSALGVVIASVLFAVVHAPRVVFSGVPGTQSVTAYGTLLVFSGLSFGLLYEYTQSLYIPILIHAAGNMPGTMGILFFDTSAFDGSTMAAYAVLSLLASVLLIVGYRRWAMGSLELRAWTSRTDSGTSW